MLETRNLPPPERGRVDRRSGAKADGVGVINRLLLLTPTRLAASQLATLPLAGGGKEKWEAA